MPERWEVTNFGNRGTLSHEGKQVFIAVGRTIEVKDKSLAEALSKFPRIGVKLNLRAMLRSELMALAKKRGVKLSFPANYTKEAILELLEREERKNGI